MGIPMGIPMGISVGMGWVWGLRCHPHGSPGKMTIFVRDEERCKLPRCCGTTILWTTVVVAGWKVLLCSVTCKQRLAIIASRCLQVTLHNRTWFNTDELFISVKPSFHRR